MTSNIFIFHKALVATVYVHRRCVFSVIKLTPLTHHDNFAEFHGLDDWLLKRALQTLEKQRKAELMSFDGNEGVKFF